MEKMCNLGTVEPTLARHLDVARPRFGHDVEHCSQFAPKSEYTPYPLVSPTAFS